MNSVDCHWFGIDHPLKSIEEAVVNAARRCGARLRACTQRDMSKQRDGHTACGGGRNGPGQDELDDIFETPCTVVFAAEPSSYRLFKPGDAPDGAARRPMELGGL